MDRLTEKNKKSPFGNRRRSLLIAGALALVTLMAFIAWNSLQTVRYPLQYSEEIERWAAEYEVDPHLVYALVHTESSFDPSADSAAGARGLTQMTSDTFDWVKMNIAPQEDLSFEDLYTPDVSIRFGVYFLSRCLQRYDGDVSTAAAAYHSGWGTVDGLLQEAGNSNDGRILTKFPYRQMGHYVNKINASYKKYKQLYQ